MKTSDFISFLHDRDIRLIVDGERLRVDAPKGTVTEELLAQIHQHKFELLGFLGKQPPSPDEGPAPILRRANTDPAPLSFAQERLWFLHELNPQSTVYNICRALRLTGNLNIAALDASLRDIVRRHEILHSALHLVNGQPLQRSIPPPNLFLHAIDLRARTQVDRNDEIGRLIREEAARPFDFSAGVFLRSTLLRVTDNEHILILTTHHIVSDAWSLGILRRELWMFYNSHATNRPCPINDLPIQYVDYAIWQRSRLYQDDWNTHLSYWKKKLEGGAVLNLPTDRLRPAQLTDRGARKAVALPESLTKRLKELSDRLGVTLFMTLVAAFNVLLHRYTGQEDILIGTPVANRIRTELHGLIGLFVNTVVLRTDLSGNPTFRDLLTRVRENCLEAYVHQELPFEKLVEALHPDRALNQSPLFQVMFVLNNSPQVVLEISGIRGHRIEIDPGTAKFDLTLALGETDGKWIGSIEYRTDLFDPQTIERFAGHWLTLLEGIVTDPNQPISTLPLLTAPERHQMLVTWNDTARDFPRHSCIHELFEAQVNRTPNAIALEYDGKHLSYDELNRRTNRLAYHLIGLGIGPEQRVGIWVERSLEMVIGLLAILKAGAAYVPLDPTYPKERIAFMLADSKVSLLLTSRKRLADFAGYGGVSVALDDALWAQDGNDENPASRTTAIDPAYVIYTSGSTGTPKGVIGLHRGAVNRMTWMWRAFPFEANEKSCIKTSLSFVDSVWEIFGPLLQGVPSVIVPDPVVKDARSLVRMLVDHGVTRIVLVPSLLRAILDEWPNLQAYLPHKMIWTSSGEPLSSALVDRFRKTLPESALLNLYGASEVSADVTYHDCNDQVPGTSICIGRPISNTKIFLLDSQLQPVPIGIPGEIYVAGEGLARGYLNRPALTATSFIPNPFGAEPGSRLYRTGDLARYRSDGTIELLGRMDRQVKIRGYRIELDEIETWLNQHPGVKESVVVMSDEVLANTDHQKSDITDPELNKRLVGYVVPSEPAALTVTELRNFLKEKLPEYMVPAAFVFTTALPLTPNGKIDHRALPALVGARPKVAQGWISPRTEIEELVARTWQDILKLDRIGVEDNFFDMGGSSILALQIVSRLRDVFNREIGVRSLFEKPTVVALAKEIEDLLRDGSAPRLPPITPVPRNGFLPLSINQEQLWRLDKTMPGTYFFNMPYVYRIGRQLDVAALKRALQQIVQRHEALRTIFTEVDGNPVQVIKDGTDFKLSVVDLRKYPPAKSLARAADLILLEREQSFNLAAGPLVRAKLLRLTDRESYLLLTLHHIVGDHWSMQQLRRELLLTYESIVQGRPLEHPPLRIQFGDFAAWERQQSDSASMTHQLAYWKHQLSEPLSKLRFQKVQRFKRPTGNRRINRQFEISDALFTAIKSLAIRENCSVSMVMLTALTLLLYSYTKQRDIRIGVLVANRRSSDTEAVFGHFVNTVVIRTRVSPGMTSNQLLKDVRAATIEAYAHQELPFEKLAQVLEAERNIDRASLFQVLCNYQKVQPEPPRPAGITIAPFQVSRVAGVPEASITPIELIFDIRETSTKLTVGVNRRSGVLNKSQSLRMNAHLTNILAALVRQARTVESVSIEIASAYQ